MTDKNQYVHRRDSISLATLSDQEIKQRMKLGLVTNVPYQHQDYHNQEDDDDYDEDDQTGSDNPLEDWDDLQDSEDEDGKDKGPGQRRRSSTLDEDEKEYVFDTKRRSSVDLDSLSANLHDLMSAADNWDGNNCNDGIQNKRRRSKRPNVASIQEQDDADDEEIETVNGDDMDVPNNTKTV
jgi:hypothetical protein